MNDKTKSTSERAVAGKPVKAGAEPVRAEIFMPGAGQSYRFAGKGGVTTKQKKPAATPEPAATAPAPPAPAPATAPAPAPAPAAPPAKQAAKAAPAAAPAKPTAKKPPAAKPEHKPAPMPGRKPPKKTGKKAPSPAEQSQALAENVITSFTDKLTVEATAKGGYLSVQDLQTMNKDFKRQTEDLKVVFEKSFEDYVVARERAAWSKSRKFPFDRMIVKTFSYMLESDSRKLRRSDSVSRRILPGFFLALGMMLGPDKYEAYQGKCRAVVKILKKEYGADFEWDDIYDSDDARAIVIDALIDIARHFEDFDKRRAWFVDMVNAHLPPADDTMTQTEAEWTFSEQGFDNFFAALISDLTDALESEGGRMLITRRHGVDATIELIELMKKLTDEVKKPF